MNNHFKISERMIKNLVCPCCKTRLISRNDHLECTNIDCKALFPVINGIPILINDSSSVFSINDFLDFRKTYFTHERRSKAINVLRKLIPTISRNIKGKSNFTKVEELLLKENGSPSILILGGSILGDGMDSIVKNPSIDLVETDISFGPRTKIICDAHDIPFESNLFDAVIVQAVLEHVLDPYRCCDEIHRVLKPNGIVYAETPFMQQVHGGKYDFTRFTHLGHRRLFRRFIEIESGAVCGPGMALAWSFQYFLLSFTTSDFLRMMIRGFCRVTTFFLKYFDYILIDKPGTLDAASGLYFIGLKSDIIISDRELLMLFRGAK